MNANKEMISKVLLAGTIAVLTGCAATQTVLENRNLEATSSLSKTLFLDPVAANQKTIFIEVRNTSEESIDIAKPLADTLMSHGYKVVNNPAQAHYILQANILKIAKMSVSASKSVLGGGFGSTLAGAGTGVAVGALINRHNSTLGGGIAGGLIGLAADSIVKDVNIAMVTDVQISERVGNGVHVKEQFTSELSNGTHSTTQQMFTKDSQFQRYQRRIVSNAHKVNLTYQQAKPMLEQGLVKTLAGIF